MAELRQKIIQCPTCNQYFDSMSSPRCPYCYPTPDFKETMDPFADSVPNASGGSTAEPFDTTIAPDPVRAHAPGGFDPTIAPAPVASNGGRGFDPTIAPGPVPVSPEMSVTQYVDTDNNAGAPTPVVGWLVAISGAAKGADYRIHTGYNDIGRKYGDIIIRDDKTISAEKDANVTYVEQTRKFYIAHVQGKNVLSVNDVPVIGGSTELKPYDIINIGSTKLLFIPLCGERFSWKDVANG